jgi:tetratricopeptide (TPR) repeat protein
MSTVLSPTRRIAACAAALFLVVAGAWWFYAGPSPKEASPPVPRYVGDESCRACHREIFQNYRRTAMGRSWYRPDPSSTVEDYTKNNHVYDASRDLHYQMIARDGEFFQREYRLDDHGKVTHELIRPVSYVVGSGNHVRSYVTDSNGYLTQMPISWYTDEKKWDLSPGYHRFNHRFDRPIRPTCFACHNDYAHYVPWSNNRYEGELPTGIGCERCHGPAEWHVHEYRDGIAPPAGAAHPAIVNPANLSPALSNDVCFQCHLQGDAEFVNPGKGPFDFRPGMRLADCRSVYLAEAEDDEKFGIASHATRMVLSRCYVESGGRLTCIVCHDPHLPLADYPVENYRAGCQTCHESGACNRIGDSSPADRQDNCVFCHLPRGEPSDVQHTVFTDHWIRRRLPHAKLTESAATKPRNLDSGQRPADQSMNSRSMPPTRPGDEGFESKPIVPLRDFFDDARNRDERDGMAQLTFATVKGSKLNLQFGLGQLNQLAAHRPLSSEAWSKMGRAALLSGQFGHARVAFEQAIETDPTDAAAVMGLGLALRMSGQPEAALVHLERAIRLAPDQLETYPPAAEILAQQGIPEKAVSLLEHALSRNPHQPTALAALAWLKCYATGEISHGLAIYRTAIELDPDNVALRVAIAEAYLVENDLSAARSHLFEALRQAPQHVPTLAALGRLEIRVHDPNQAVQWFSKVLELDAQNVEARQALRRLSQPPGPDALESKLAK